MAQSSGSVRTEFFLRWWRFTLVGGIGIAVQLGLLVLLKSVLHFNYLVATGLAVEATVVHNFLWHEHYTWVGLVRPSWSESVPRLVKFNLTNGAVSLVGNLFVMKVMVAFAHKNYLAGSGIAIVSCSMVNFLVSEVYVFEKKHYKPAHKYSEGRLNSSLRG